MNNQTGFKKKSIAAAVACALSGTALAQETASEPVGEGASSLEEIVVTGIRASLERAVDRKRYAQGVVDAISAEDMGDFPDTNLAESLQRITGVSIDRRDGEGSKITVRGLGPDFNLVTLNGRQMPGAGLETTTASGSRSFDFANLASEGVAAVEVYKTARADMPSGGMGATVNIITPKPLTAAPQRSIAAQGVWDSSAESPDMAPEVSGIFSDSFMDGKLGVAVTASHQVREGATNSVTTGGFHNFPGTVVQDWSGVEGQDFAWGGIDFLNGNHVNQPAPEDFMGNPQSVAYAVSEFERTRTNGQLTLQFAPVDNLVTTLDYTISENEIDGKVSDAGFWFNFGGQNSIFTDFDSPAVQSPLLISDNSANDVAYGSGINTVKFENESIGLNVEWEATDRLRFTLDAHSSSAEAGPNSPFGTNASVATSAFVRQRTTASFEEDNPTVFLDIENSDGGSDVRIEDLQVSGSFFRSGWTENNIDQVQFDTDWKMTDEVNVKLGLGRIEGEFESSFSVVQNDTWGGVGEPGQFAGSDFFTLDSFLGKVGGDFADDLTAEEAAVLEMNNTQPFNQFYRADFHDIRNFAAANFDTGEGPAQCFDGATQFCGQPPNNFNAVQEDIDYFYASVSIERELPNGMPYGVNLGVRHEETDIESPGTVQQFAPIRWVSNNEFSMRQVGTTTEVFSGDYSATLPSIDFKLNVTEDLVFRASWGESLARPNWLNLVGGSNFAELVRIDGGDGRRGNPGLQPIESENFDLSLEWYYGNGSAVTLAYFEKDIDNFIGNRIVTEQAVPNSPHPAMGPRAQAAIDSGISPNDAGGIRQFIFENFPDPETAFMNANGDIIIVGIPGEDPDSSFDVTEVSNERSAKVDGWEFAVQHNFWDTGFGVIANYTIVDESTSFDNFADQRDPQFAITGVSDTANLIAFYDKNGLQARLAYNWRDEFLASTATATGNNPVNVDSFAQLDGNISYQFTDNLTVFLEGINLTDARGEIFGRAEEQVLGVFESGPRYHLGARYKF